MESDSKYPDWLYDAVFDDGIFAAAYASVSAPQRACLKTCIARLYDWFGPAKILESTTHSLWRQGFSSIFSTAPRSRCCLLLDHEIGPAALLAALLPARVSGVSNVVVVFVGEGEPSSSVLAALELAGQDLALGADGDFLEDILKLHTGPTGCVMALGQARNLCTNLRVPFWIGPDERTISVWMDSEYPIDLNLLSFAHPEAQVTVMGMIDERELPHGFILSSGTFEDMLALGAKAVFVPSTKLNQALLSACLVLGPGHEGCWVYPGLNSSFFSSTKVAWA